MLQDLEVAHGIFPSDDFDLVHVVEYPLTSRRFQRHTAFAMLCYDIERRRKNGSNVRLFTNATSWSRTKGLLDSLTRDMILEAQVQAKQRVSLHLEAR